MERDMRTSRLRCICLSCRGLLQRATSPWRVASAVVPTAGQPFVGLFNWVESLGASDRPTAFFEGLVLIGSKFEFDTWLVRDLLSSVRHLEEAQRIKRITHFDYPENCTRR